MATRARVVGEMAGKGVKSCEFRGLVGPSSTNLQGASPTIYSSEMTRDEQKI
jgi:hypothetical protein